MGDTLHLILPNPVIFHKLCSFLILGYGCWCGTTKRLPTSDDLYRASLLCLARLRPKRKRSYALSCHVYCQSCSPVLKPLSQHHSFCLFFGQSWLLNDSLSWANDLHFQHSLLKKNGGKDIYRLQIEHDLSFNLRCFIYCELLLRLSRLPKANLDSIDSAHFFPRNSSTTQMLPHVPSSSLSTPLCLFCLSSPHDLPYTLLI